MPHADYRVALKCTTCGARIASVSAEAVRRVIAAGGFLLARYTAGRTNNDIVRVAADALALKCARCEPTQEA